MKQKDVCSEKSTVSLTLIGDFFCSMKSDSNERALIEKYLSSKIHPIINFEGSFETNTFEKKSIRLASDPSILPSLGNCTISLANNHVLDYQEKGLHYLMQELDKNSIPYFGVNSNSTKIDNFRIIDFDGIRVCFLGFGAKNEECIEPTSDAPGILDFNRSNLNASIKALDPAEFDYLILYAHIGYEFEKYPLPLHVGLCREAIDLGVDLVYCSHTHCLQPYELYDEKYIFYGLGNFYFSENRDGYPVDSDVGAMVSICLSRENHNISLAGVEKITYKRPVPGLSIEIFSDYKKLWILDGISLNDYSRNYSANRTRKKNPRPILYYDRPLSNYIKYFVWKLIVDITGALGIRKIIKQLLRWQ